ncbi:MAG: S26 family signal peptidase [Pseudomonadota bacterium]
MRYLIVILTLVGLGLMVLAVFFNPQDRLIWNRTASAPTGLYWLNDDPFTPGRWVVVSASSDDARWAQSHGFVGKDWPLLKQIVAVSGDEICRLDGVVSVNGQTVGKAKDIGSQGRSLPVWTGCQVLTEAEVLLMNSHPESLDGRYFGATDISDLDGVAALIWEF